MVSICVPSRPNEDSDQRGLPEANCLLNQLETAEMWSEAVLWFWPVVVQSAFRVFSPARVAT
jgi:hypothetical protein